MTLNNLLKLIGHLLSFYLSSLKIFCFFFFITTLNSCQIQQAKVDDISNFTLKPFAEIKGVGAASGLIYGDDIIYIVSDNSDVLYQYQVKTQQLKKTSLRSDQQTLENIDKKEKSDFEATAFDNQYHIFGSGSGKNRNQLSILDNIQGNLTVKSLDKLYESCRNSADISEKDFNIEGVVIDKNSLLLFNRGNGPNNKNGIFRIENWKKDDFDKPVFYRIPLPTVADTAFGFTDVIKIKDKIYFLAAAEGANSTYYDGEILGSMIGIINSKTMTLEKTQTISNHHKFEGITPFEIDGKSKTFLLCEDPDNGLQETVIYQMSFRIF